MLGGRRARRSSCSTRRSSTSAPGGASTRAIYLLSALAAVVFAIDGRNGLAAALLAVCADDQAAGAAVHPAVRGVVLGARRAGARSCGPAAIGLAVIVVLWLPFIPAGGPLDYLRNLAEYQNEIFPILSLRAWNVWWLRPDRGRRRRSSRDQVAVLGPITLRHVGFVADRPAVARRRDRRSCATRRPRTLILGLAASTLDLRSAS